MVAGTLIQKFRTLIFCPGLYAIVAFIGALSAGCSSSSGNRTQESSKTSPMTVKELTKDLGARGPFEVSDDCKDWRPGSADEVWKQGYVRKDGTTLFVDLEAKMYVTVTGKSSPFFYDTSDEKITFIGTPSGINGIPKEKETSISDVWGVMQSSQDSAAFFAKGSRWLPIFIDERTKLVALIVGELCTRAPSTTFINCSTDPLNCALYPAIDSDSAGPLADVCLAELKLSTEEKLRPVHLACEYFQSSLFEERRRLAIEKANACGPEGIKAAERLPSLKRIETGCESLEGALLEFKRRKQ